MPGFVDVSNMSDLEIKRLGHADDYDDVVVQHRHVSKRNPYGYNSTTRPVGAKHSVSDVWAAACAAHRINRGYHKDHVYEWDETQRVNRVVLRKNRQIMMEFLANPDQLTVDDVERGEHCRNFLQNDLTFRTIKGKTVEFDNAIRKVLAIQDHFDTYHHKYELAIVACLPASVEKTEQRQTAENRMKFAQGGLVGEVGNKVALNVEVISANFSKQYNIFWIRAVTAEDQVVTFSNKQSFDVGSHLTIQGKVKAHKDNLTQLNYVKVL